MFVLNLKAFFVTGVWAHGDYCKINPKTGGIVMLGRRSDMKRIYSGRSR